MRYLLTLLILTVAALPQTAPKAGEATITLYYPQGPAETITVPDILWKVQGGCVHYTHKGDSVIFCGTFKIVLSK